LSTTYLQGTPPALFQYNQSTFQAFYFFENIYIDTTLVAPNDWVGIFNCKKWNSDSTACSTLGACVGSRKYDTSKCGGGICDLPAMGDGADGKSETGGYLLSGEYPVFLIYDESAGVYYKTKAEGDVRIQKDVCRNGYPFCYGWQNQSFPFSSTLIGNEVYMDCMGKLGGNKVLDNCGICSGSGPQYKCEKTGKFY
jgi:hypothetical protein